MVTPDGMGKRNVPRHVNRSPEKEIFAGSPLGQSQSRFLTRRAIQIRTPFGPGIRSLPAQGFGLDALMDAGIAQARL